MSNAPYSRRNLLSLIAAAVALAACGGSVDRNVEPYVTIAQGIYGQTIDYNDIAPARIAYGSWELEVFRAPRDGAPALAQGASDERGFYEFALDAGEFEICVSVDHCEGFTVFANERFRLDYQNFERGWHEPVEE